MPNQIKLHPDGMDLAYGIYGTLTQLEEALPNATPARVYSEWLCLRHDYIDDIQVNKAATT